MNLPQPHHHSRHIIVLSIVTIIIVILWIQKENVVTKVSNAVASHICDSHGISQACDCSANDHLDFQAVCEHPHVCFHDSSFCGNLQANVTAQVASGSSLRHPPVQLEACLSLQEVPRMVQTAMNLLSSQTTLPDVCLVAAGELSINSDNDDDEQNDRTMVSWETCQMFVNHHHGEPCECTICEDGTSFRFDCGSNVLFSLLANRCIPMTPPPSLTR